ncbi:hypothetical protein PCANC_12436 [Puccinia coronata f. sp. avenae]|uniref:Uncharacterized protein n=1 Tax=Puccinia coronata f. sp. avenae TaxID=200324 RepID=A0A2N5T090_9BASI|nr:hypothetical protein PCANC_12436 [Puccinia coronata f. sp. avenae]
MLMSLLLHRRSTTVQSTASFQGEHDRASNTTWRFMQHHSLSLYFLVLISTILILFPNGASASEHNHIDITPRALYDITLADSAAGSSKGSPNAYNSSAGITTTTGNTVKQNASLVGSASSRRNTSSPVARGDASLPQCGAHQNMFATNSTTGLTSKLMSTGSGIATTDCYYALGHLLHMKNDVLMLQMNSTTNYTKKKSCGSCRLEIQGNYSKELLVPLDVVMFGTSQDRSGGLNGLLRQCHKRGGQVTVAAREKLSTTLRIDVSKTSTHRICS